jgi:hypothetical protein
VTHHIVCTQVLLVCATTITTITTPTTTTNIKWFRCVMSMCECMQADCIQQVGTQVISKSVGSNTLQCCDAQSGKMQRQIDIAADTTSTSGFDVSIDQRLLCVGTTTGLVAVIEVQSGKCIATLEHKRVRQSVNACVFSADARYVVLATRQRERERERVNDVGNHNQPTIG